MDNVQDIYILNTPLSQIFREKIPYVLDMFDAVCPMPQDIVCVGPSGLCQCRQEHKTQFCNMSTNRLDSVTPRNRLIKKMITGTASASRDPYLLEAGP
jgi:hypothetical protein